MTIFNDAFPDRGFTRTGIEIGGRVRVGWFGGHIPTLFFFGHPCGRESGIHQKQIRVWRIAVSVRAENRKIAIANAIIASPPQSAGVKCKDRGD